MGPRRNRWVRQVALALAFALAPACENAEAGPEEQARRFAAAVRSANEAAVLDMLDDATRQHVDRTAQIATDRVGGRRVIEGAEVFQIVGVDRSFDVASSKVLSADEETAQVELTSPSGATAIVDLRYEPADERTGREAGWRVSLPLPEGMTRLSTSAS